MAKTAVELVINEIDQQQKRYIDLAKKDKSIKKEVDAILTATTLLKMKCGQAKELEKQQIIDARVNGVCEGIDIGARPIGQPITEDISKNHEIYYNETFKK